MEDLERLRRQYFSLVPPRLVQIPSLDILLTEDAQRYLLEKLVFPPNFMQPEDGYRRSFWRKIIDQLEYGLSNTEDDGIEIDERFYELISTLMIQPNSDLQEPKPTYRTFIYNHPAQPSASTAISMTPKNDKGKQKEVESSICLLEEQTVLQGGTTGLRTWTAALQLGHHLIHNRNLIISDHLASPETGGHMSIVELGAGTGFLSILLSQLGFKIISTDLDGNDGGIETPLSRLKHNVNINHAEQDLQVAALDWNDVFLEPSERPDIWRDLYREECPRVVIAADVVYDPDLLESLVETIRILLLPIHSSFALIAATERNPETLKGFLSICELRDLKVKLLDLPEIDKDNPTFWDCGLDASVPVRVMLIKPSNYAKS